MVIFGQKRPILGQITAKNDHFSAKEPVFDPQKCPKLAKNHPKITPKPGLPPHTVDFQPIWEVAKKFRRADIWLGQIAVLGTLAIDSRDYGTTQSIRKISLI